MIFSCDEKPEKIYPEVLFRNHNYQIVSKDCDTAGTCASVELNYPEFYGMKNTPVEDILNSYISTAILADDYIYSSSASVDELGQNFIDEYENFLSEFTDYRIGWALERDIKVIYNHQNIISLEFYEYSFMGGAHPNTVKTYQSFELNTGDKIVIDDKNILNQIY